MAELLRHIVIVGGDACATSVAACVANSLRGTDTKITLVDKLSGYSGIASTLPTTTDFYKALRFGEQSLVAGTGATFKLGTEHSGWLQSGERFIQSFSDYGIPIRLLPFYQYFINERLAGRGTNFDDYSVAATAAQNGRFALPSAESAATSQPYQYGLQVDRQRFGGAMLQYAIAAGVEHIVSNATQVAVGPDTGFIESVTLDDGAVISGDFFIDCSGQQGLLIGDALGTGYRSWSEFLPCDRCVSVSIRDVQDLSPITRLVAKKNGWSRRIQLLDRADVEFFYRGEITNDDDAAKQLSKDFGTDVTAVQDYRSIRIGRRESFWRGNCVAIGRSAGEFEPLEVSFSSLAHSAVLRLMSLWPHTDCNPLIVDEYNRLTSREYEFARDFVALFYALSDREDSDFWHYCQSLKTPEGLASRLTLFRSRGRLNWAIDDIFSRDYWISALIGLNCMPHACDPLVDVADAALVAQYLTELRQEIDQNVSKMPTHIDFLRDLHAAAAKPTDDPNMTSSR